MSLYVSFLIKSNKKWSLQGSYERSKIWRKKAYFGYSRRHQVHNHMNFQPSLPLPHMLQLLSRFLLLSQQKLCNIEFIFEKEAVARESERRARVRSGPETFSYLKKRDPGDTQRKSESGAWRTWN
jgi:hypothetical protein